MKKLVKVLVVMFVLFVVSLQPLEMISILIVLTLLCSLVMCYLLGGFWFSYLLLLVIVSGILVVFVYMASLIPNESYEMMGVMFCFIFGMGMVYCGVMMDFGVNCSMVSVKLWENMIFFLNLFVVMFLLVIMLIVVVMSSVGVGPIRVSF